MKQSPLITLLLVMVCGLSAMVLLLVITMEFHFKTVRKLQPILATNQMTQNRIQALAIDVVEYSKQNPAIDPILQAVGLKASQPLPPATNKPAGK